jgi:carboxypeptidase Taq
LRVSVESPPLDRLRSTLAELDDLRHAEAVLDWDSRVSMPHRGAAARADATATVTRLIHERFVSDEIGELLDDLAPLERERGPDSFEGALIRLTRREWERARRVPTELAGEISHAAGIAVAAWDEAKAASDFQSFVPHLERMLELKRRYVACFPPADEPYDVLLDDYEEEMTTAEVTRVFDRLKEVLVPLVDAQRNSAGDDAFLRGPFPVERQREAGRRVLDAFGFDERSWRLDETPHPFAQKPGLGDIRLTTHTEERDLTALFSTMHEFGHGVYEDGVDEALARTPLGTGASAAIHESQSRTWENLVGRSRGFWRWFYPQLQEIFPERLRGVDEELFVRSVNAVRPGPLRGDADEVTYGLHIILRFELELQMLSGAIAVRDLPEAWNAATASYLDVGVPDDAHGVLEDTHWAIGLLGYFPTYQLGNVISIQIWDRARQDVGDVEEQFARGDFAPVREWLREHVYRHGSMYPPRELLRRVTGADLDPEPYLAYLRAKFG